MHAILVLTAASDGVVVLGGVFALVRGVYRLIRAVEAVGARLDNHEDRLRTLELTRRGA